jgi:sec-independent protein translocase protein TatA
MGLPFHPFWLIILLAIVLIIFGPGKLPELGGAVGRGIREFRKASNDITSEMRSSVEHKEATPEPTTPVTPVPPATTTTSASENKAEPEKTS